MTCKLQAEFIPQRVRKNTYGHADAAGVFIWNPPAVDTEEDYAHDIIMWKTGQASGLKQYDDYFNNGEYIILAIQGQVEPSVWDKTKADVRFPAIEAAKCPITLINLMKERATDTQSGLWPPLAYMTHIQKNVGLLQNPKWGGTTSIGEYKRQVDSGVDTATRLGGNCTYGTAMMIPFLTDNGETLATYFAMTPAQQAPYDSLYKDMIVTVIMLKNCGYDTLRTWLSQQYMGPAAQAYPIV